MMDANKNEATAARWLLRREQPDWTAQDQAELDAWLDEAAEHKVAFWRLEYGWSKVGRIAALRAPRPASHHGRRPHRRAWRRMARAAMSAAAIAACLVAVLVSDVRIRDGGNPEALVQKTYETRVGGNETVALSDGSTVQLNTATVLRTAVGRSTRNVWLERGEAYFQVAHDPSRPFVVHAGDRTVTVLGTKFSVLREDDRVKVSVVQGRVRVSDANPDVPPVVITKGDVVIAKGASNLVKYESVQEVDADLSWRNGILHFDRMTLAEAAAEFNRYNRTQLVVSDPRIAQIRIGGSFKATSADAFARLLHRAYGFKVTQDGDVLKISE